MRNLLSPEEEIEVLENRRTLRLNQHNASVLKRLRHERKSIEKLVRAIEHYANDGPTAHVWWLGHLLVAFYRDQPTKLYDVILQILGPEYRGCPGNAGWRKEVNFEAFLQYKREMEKG